MSDLLLREKKKKKKKKGTHLGPYKQYNNTVTLCLRIYVLSIISYNYPDKWPGI